MQLTYDEAVKIAQYLHGPLFLEEEVQIIMSEAEDENGLILGVHARVNGISKEEASRRVAELFDNALERGQMHRRLAREGAAAVVASKIR